MKLRDWGLYIACALAAMAVNKMMGLDSDGMATRACIVAAMVTTIFAIRENRK